MAINLSTKSLPEMLDDLVTTAKNAARAEIRLVGVDCKISVAEHDRISAMIREQIIALFDSLREQVAAGIESEIHGKTDVTRDMEASEL